MVKVTKFYQIWIGVKFNKVSTIVNDSLGRYKSKDHTNPQYFYDPQKFSSQR